MRGDQPGVDRAERADMHIRPTLLPTVITRRAPQRRQIARGRDHRLLPFGGQRHNTRHIDELGQRPQPRAGAVKLKFRPIVRADFAIGAITGIQQIGGGERLACLGARDTALKWFGAAVDHLRTPAMKPGGAVPLRIHHARYGLC